MLARDPEADSTRQLAYRHQAEIVHGNVNDRSSIAAGMRDCDAVIHLVGIISEFGGNTFQSAHVEATRQVVSVARDQGVERYVHMSALGARENAPSRYHQSKWLAEEVVRSSSLDWTIFRPSVIFGRSDGFVNLLAAICRWSPVAVVMGKGRNKLQPIAVEDVAHCFVSSLKTTAGVKQTFDLCGSQAFTLDEIYDLILKTTQRRRFKVHIPIPLANIQASVMERFFNLLGRTSPLTRDQLLMLQEDNVGNPLPAQEQFEFEPASFATGIARYLK